MPPPVPEAEPGYSAFGQADVGFSLGGVPSSGRDGSYTVFDEVSPNEVTFHEPGFGQITFGEGGPAEPASFAATTRDTGRSADAAFADGGVSRPVTPPSAGHARRVPPQPVIGGPPFGGPPFGSGDPSPPGAYAQPLPPGGPGRPPALHPPPDHRTTAGIRRTAPEPPADHRTTAGLARPTGDGPAYPSHGTGSHHTIGGTGSSDSGSHVVPPEARGTHSGSYAAIDAPQTRSARSGSYPAVPGEGRASASGRFRSVSDEGPSARSGSHRIVSEGRSTSTGNRRAVRESGTGSHRVASEGRSTSTGSRRAVRDDATSTGSRRAVREGRSGATGSHRVVSEGPSTASGGHSTITGTHRAMGPAVKRRKIAKWPIFTGVFIVLVIGGLLAWGWASNVLNSRAEAQANACTDGDSNMTVVVTPSVQKPVAAAADRWNQAKTVVHAHCVHVDIRAVPSQQVLDALTGKTDLATIGGMPAAWLPENSYFVSQLQTTKPGLVGAPPESVASASSADYPFVGLAANTIDEVQARAAQVFRDYLREPAQQADFTKVGLTGG